MARRFIASPSGGGDVTFGATAGTAAEGNDVRIVGAAQKSANLVTSSMPGRPAANGSSLADVRRDWTLLGDRRGRQDRNQSPDGELDHEPYQRAR